VSVSILQRFGCIISVLSREWVQTIINFSLHSIPRTLIFAYILNKNRMTKTHLNDLETLNLVNLVFPGSILAKPYEIG
jgi:hypothetical protein